MILKKNHKFSAVERRAISGLLCDLDELDNKPRRLYSALKDFAFAFFSSDDHYKEKSNHSDIIMSIEEAEDRYYLGNSIQSTLLYNMNEDINNIIREETKQAYEHDEKFDEYHAKRILNKLAMKVVEKVFPN